MNKALFSSNKDDWTTPEWLFDKLNQEFDFTLDAAADDVNHKRERYFTAKENALTKSWEGETVFCNPPYGRKIGDWVKKAYEEGKKPGTTVVLLIPSRTDTSYFHEYILGKAEIRFLKGRLKFGGGKRQRTFPEFDCCVWWKTWLRF